jgi:hypothetical protein
MIVAERKMQVVPVAAQGPSMNKADNKLLIT